MDTKLSTTNPLFATTRATTSPENKIAFRQARAASILRQRKSRERGKKITHAEQRSQNKERGSETVERASIEVRSAVEVHRDQRREITWAQRRLVD